MSREARWLIALVGLGLVWRVVRYALCFPVWQDEAYLSISILFGDYEQLFREPLAYLQIAPLGFLWLQRLVVEQLGGGEYALRLGPLIAGCAALVLFSRLAWEQLPPRAAAISAGVFAVSYVLVRHSVEAKQYATDALLATTLIYAAARWQKSTATTRWAPSTTVIASVGVWCSYPLVFVTAGVALALLPGVVRARTRHAWLNWASYCAAVMASFALFYGSFAAGQSARATGTWLEAYWQESFPPRGDVTALIWWLLDVHAGKMLAYPLGGGNFASSLTLLLCIAGGAALYRSGRRGLLGLLLAPIPPALLAALLHRYPYGGSARVCIYLAPTICLLCGFGVHALLAWSARRASAQRAIDAVCALLLLIAGAGVALDVVQPYKEPQYAAARNALRDVATYIPRKDEVFIANAMHDRNRPPDGPEFHPTLLYYFVLYTDHWPSFCGGQPPASTTRWMLSFYGAEFGPKPARLAELLAPVGLQPTLHRDYRLSPKFDWRLGVFRCEPLAATTQAEQ